MTDRMEIRGIFLTLDPLLQTVTTMNTTLITVEIVRDYVLFIKYIRLVDPLNAKTLTTSHQSNC